MAHKIQHRRDSAANWSSVDPILSEGEIGFDLTNKIFKVGDGISNWSTLPTYDSALAEHAVNFHSDVDGWANTNPSMDGVAAQGSSNRIARQDHVHPTDTSREPANANIQSHISNTDNPHSVSIAQIGAEPANANIQSHISRTDNPHSVTAAQAGAVAVNTAITGGTHTKITYDAKGLVTAGSDIAATDIPALDASKVTSGVFDIARIPAAALERLVPVANQTARFALTTNEVQLGDTVKQLDTGIMYVVIDTANLANASGYAEYTAATAAAVPWSGVQSKPTTLSGYGITDAAASTHVHGNITNTGYIGSTAGLPIVTSTSGIVAAGSWYASTPAAPTTTGDTGSSTSPARGDHAHPSRIATSAPASPVNGDIWMV